MTHDVGPIPSTPGVAPSSQPRRGTSARAAGSLATAIGGALGPPLDLAHGIVQDFMRSGKITRVALQQLGAALDDARAVAQQTRTLADLESAALPADHAPQRLDILVAQALARHMPQLRRHRVQLQQPAAAPVWVAMDAELLPRLIDAAIAWCTRPDHRLAVSLESSADLATVLLCLRLEADAPATDAQGRSQQLAWLVLEALARGCGARLLCREEGPQVLLALALRREHDVAQDPAPGDLLTSHDSLLLSDVVPLQHPRVLLITRHEDVRTEVEHVCASLGATMDWVATGTAAMRQFAQARADLVLVDERNADAATARLQQQLQAEAADFPWITLAQQPSASLTQWSRDDVLTLTNLRSQLATTLLYGLPRSRPRG
ncbi:MAG TPA: hypothetical protein VMS38_11060 [Pseudorhodoferax sp.]|nr:hypothetical protein [Pseudorhodoferax sp.]